MTIEKILNDFTDADKEWATALSPEAQDELSDALVQHMKGLPEITTEQVESVTRYLKCLPVEQGIFLWNKLAHHLAINDVALFHRHTATHMMRLFALKLRDTMPHLAKYLKPEDKIDNG